MPRDPAALVPLTAAASEFDAAAIAEALTAEGIPATHYGLAATALGPYANTANPFPVMVRRGDLVAATAALKRIRQESVDLDWSEVHGDQTEDPPTEVRCATCDYPLTGLEPEGPGVPLPCPECGGTERKVVRIPAPRKGPDFGGPFWTPSRKIGLVLGLLFIVLLVSGYLNSVLLFLRSLLGFR